jgi:hypothetical protein
MTRSDEWLITISFSFQFKSGKQYKHKIRRIPTPPLRHAQSSLSVLKARYTSLLQALTARLVSSGLPSRFSRSGEKKFNQINFLIFYSAVDSCNRVGGGLCFQKT